MQLLEKFIKAARSADREHLFSLLAEDAILNGDGGGRVATISRALHGARGITRFICGISRLYPGRMTYRITSINGLPGILRYFDDKLESAISINTDGKRILEIYIVRNPDKLAQVSQQTL